AGLARDPEEAHDVVPDADVRGPLETVLDSLLRGRLVHELEHALAPGLVAVMEELTPRGPRVVPDRLVREALLEPHVGRPHDVHVGLDKPSCQLAEQSRRVGLVGEVEIPGVVFGVEMTDILDDLLDLLGPVYGRVDVKRAADAPHALVEP